MSARAAAEETVMLEQEIVATLTDADITSSDVSALIERTEAAIAEADQAAEVARSEALDPALSPDPKTARAAMEDAAFNRDRLRRLLPRLTQKFTAVAAAEAHARWQAEYERVKAKVDESAERFAQYPALAAKLLAIFREAEEVDREVARVNGSAPDGAHGRLRQVELVARGLAAFSTADPQIAKLVQLPDFEHSDRMAWPPPKPSLAVELATSMTFCHRSGGDWWQQREQRAQAMREEHARVIDHYDSMARAHEEREAAEVRAVQERRAAE